jgi:hypothetical protein
MRATKRRILTWTITRATLTRLAPLLATCERDESAEVLATLIGEIEALQHGNATAEIWKQATADMDGPAAYGLERIGLWPASESEVTTP